jgi:hypothetical protein
MGWWGGGGHRLEVCTLLSSVKHKIIILALAGMGTWQCIAKALVPCTNFTIWVGQVVAQGTHPYPGLPCDPPLQWNWEDTALACAKHCHIQVPAKTGVMIVLAEISRLYAACLDFVLRTISYMATLLMSVLKHYYVNTSVIQAEVCVHIHLQNLSKLS